MAWVKLDDQFPDHPKVVSAGPLAAWLYVCGLTYANRHLTDGFIPAGVVGRLADLKSPNKLAATLVAVGLWEVAEGGYRIHDYLTYQPSADKVRRERDSNAVRQDAWRHRRNGITNDPHNAITNEGVTGAPYPVPVRTPEDAKELEGNSAVAGAAFAVNRPPPMPISSLVGLSDGAREAVEIWRAAHGKRSPPKLSPAAVTKLEKAVIELGDEWLRPAMTWSAERGIPEFDKAINAAYTARQRSENVQIGTNGTVPKPRGSSRAKHH